MNHNYTNARDNAWRYLIRHKVKKLPVDVFELCRRDKIKMLPYSTEKAKRVAALLDDLDLMERTDGFVVQVDEITILLWDDSKPFQRQRFTVAHELAHKLLGHLQPKEVRQSQCSNHATCSECSNCIEWQADSLAFNLLCPDFT